LRQFTPLLALLLASCAASDERSGASPRVSFASVSDDRLAFLDMGRSEPVILVHGGFQDYRMWLSLIPAFARDHRVVAYSRRNHYPNSADRDGTPNFASDVHADDLFRLIQALRLGRVHLVAHSRRSSS
jgi:non-heme chloroperoxidase